MKIAVALVELGLGCHAAVTSYVWLTIGSWLPPSSVCFDGGSFKFERGIPLDRIDVAPLHRVFGPHPAFM